MRRTLPIAHTTTETHPADHRDRWRRSVTVRRSVRDETQAWLMVFVPMLVAVAAAFMITHVVRGAAVVLDDAELAAEIRAVAAAVGRDADDLERGVATSSEGDFDDFESRFARVPDFLRALRAEDATAAAVGEVRLHRLREAYGDLRAAMQPGDAGAERRARPEFDRAAYSLARFIDERAHHEQVSHVAMTAWLLVLLMVSIGIAAAIKFVDARRLRRQQLELERLSLVAESTRNAVVLAGPDGRVTWANDAFAATTGGGAVEGRPLLEALGGPGPGVLEPLAAAMAARRAHAGEFTFVRVDGTSYPVEAELVPVFDDAGELFQYAVMFGDIGARRRAEESLRVLTRVVEASPTMVMITDAGKRIVYVNRAFEAGTGYAASAAIGMQPSFMLADDMPLAAFESLERALAEEGQWRGEVRNRRRDGSAWTSYSQAFLLRGDDGAVTHQVALMLDITDERRRAAELRAARRDALAAARAKTQFMQNVSHELRTPLNGIFGAAELLRLSGLDPGQQADLEQLRHSADELHDVVSHLFDFAHLESDVAVAEHAPFALREMLERKGRALAGRAAERGLACAVELDPALPETVAGDVVLLRRVLCDLIDNAVKFTERGSVTLRAVAAKVGEASVRVRIEVADTGIGIPHERQAEIFDAFAQGDGSNTRRHGGVGLGLTMASRLVRKMGGWLVVASEPGEGSTFGFTLEMQVVAGAPVAPSPVAPAVSGPEDAGALPAVGARVLLVDDNAVNRKVAGRILERAGCRVVTAHDGAEALRLAAEGGWDVVLMDVQMPVMDGLEAARAIRAMERRTGSTRVPIVALTAHALDADRDSALAAGMDELVPKPIDPRRLVAEVCRRAAAGVVTSLAGGTPPSPGLEAVLDWDAALALVDGDEVMLGEIAGFFAADAPAMVERLRDAAQGGDLAALQRAAHSLKGACGTVGARRAGALALHVERCARGGDGAAACAGVPELARAMDELFAALGARRRRDAA